MAVEQAFKTMLGRAPSAEEARWLQSVEVSLAIRADDPVWGLILLMCAQQPSLRATCQSAVRDVLRSELRKLGALTPPPSAASPSAEGACPPALAQGSSWPLVATLTALSGVCVTVGATLQAQGAPLWAGGGSPTPPEAAALRALLLAPVGWALPLAAVAPAARALCRAWTKVTSPQSSRAAQTRGALTFAALMAALFAWYLLAHWALS